MSVYLQDDTGLAVTSTVRKITIAGNNPPVADAGPDCYVAAGQLAYLDGSGSSILGRKGWLADNTEFALISTNAEALSSLAGYAGSYPLSETHTKLLEVDGSVTNRVTT